MPLVRLFLLGGYYRGRFTEETTSFELIRRKGSKNSFTFRFSKEKAPLTLSNTEGKLSPRAQIADQGLNILRLALYDLHAFVLGAVNKGRRS